MTNVPRSRKSWIPAALGLAVLVAVGWTLLRIGRGIGTENGTTVEAADSGAPAASGSSEPALTSSASKTIRPGRRVHPGKNASATKDDAGSTDATDPTAEPYTTVILVGRVTGRIGETVGGPNTLVEVKGPNGVSSVPVSMGSYRIEDLDPGTFELRCSAPGLREEARSITIAANETEHREDFVLEPVWTVAIGLITTDGRNFLDPEVQKELPKDLEVRAVATEALPPTVFHARSYEDRVAHRGSRYVPRVRDDEVIEGDPEGRCIGRIEIYRKPPVYLAIEAQGRVLGSQRLESEVGLATFTISLDALRAVPCSVKARVVAAASGRPIPGVNVQLIPFAGRVTRVESDREGVVLARDVAPGRCTVWLEAEGRAQDRREVELLSSTENDLGTIALEDEIRLRGRFVAVDGQTARFYNAYVFPYSKERPLDALDTNLFFGMEKETSDGFEAFGLGPRSYLIVGDPRSTEGRPDPLWVSPVLVDLSHGPVDEVAVPVMLATTVLLRPDADEVRDLRYWILASNGLPCAHGEFPDRGDVQLWLGAGKFRLLVGKDSSNVREMPFTVGSVTTVVQIEP